MHADAQWQKLNSLVDSLNRHVVQMGTHSGTQGVQRSKDKQARTMRVSLWSLLQMATGAYQVRLEFNLTAHCDIVEHCSTDSLTPIHSPGVPRLWRYIRRPDGDFPEAGDGPRTAIREDLDDGSDPGREIPVATS